MSAAAFVGLGTAMALAGPGASSTTNPHANRADVDSFSGSRRGDNRYGDSNIAANDSDDGGVWSAQPSSGPWAQDSISEGGSSFAGNGAANTATHGS